MTDVAPPSAAAAAAAASSGDAATRTPATPAYRPHKMERYYAQHLLQTHFSSENNPTAPADFSHATTAALTDSTPHSIHVPGRTAVPFLTTSGVSRGTLKQIWTVVDPEGLGTLIRRSQFHSMLRLVALEEAGLLPPLPANGADAGNVLMDALTKYSHLEITLPTFDAVQMPSAAFLVGTYGDVVKGQADETQTETHHVWEQASTQQQNSSLMSAQYRQEQMAGVGMAGGMAGGMGMMSPIQPNAMQMQQNPMQQPPHQMGITNTANTTNNMMMMTGGGNNINNASYHSQPSGGSGVMMSVGDAFADLGPSEDKALPSDDFGDFEEADEDEAALEVEEVQEQAVEVVDAAATTNNGAVEGDDQPTLPAAAAAEVLPDPTATATTMGDADFPPPLAAAPQPQMDVLGGNDGVLGGVAPPPPPPMGMDMGMDLPPPPLPAGPPPSQPPAPMDGAEEPQEEKDSDDDDDDDDDEGFGDFEGMDDGTDNVEAPVTTASSTADGITSHFGNVEPVPPAMSPPLAVPSGGEGMGEFGTVAPTFGEQALSDPLSVSDAFAALGPSSDAPLPAEPLGVPEPKTINTDGTEEQEEDDDDDNDGFGDFGAADGAGHDGGDIAIPDETPLEIANEATDLPAQTPAEADDSFGGFEDHSMPLPSTSDAPQEAFSDDPFAALGPAEDAPLPAEPFGSTEAVADTANDGIGATEEGNDDDDDFGTFEAVQASEPSSEAAVPLPNIPPPLPPSDVKAEADFLATSGGPFSVIGPAEDAPLPILSMDTAETSPPDEPIADVNDLPAAAAKDGDDDDDDDDDFGSFEEVEADDVKEPGSDEAVANANEVADPQIVPNIDANEAMEHPMDVPPHDVPPPLPAAQEAAGEAPSDDPFAVIGPNADAPLPVLSCGSAEAEVAPDAGADDSDDDDFGEFEEIPESDLPPAELEVKSQEDELVTEIIEEGSPDALGEEAVNIVAVDVPQLPTTEMAEVVVSQVLDASVLPLDAPVPPPRSQVSGTSSDDPFSVLGAQEDAPLPVFSFSSATSAATDSPADAFGTVSGGENGDKGDNDGFGAFETNPSSEGIGESTVVEGPTESAPVTTKNESDDDDDDDDDGFGDFGGGNASETEVPVPTDGNEISPVQETSPSDLGLFGPPVGESTPALQELTTADAVDFGVSGPPSDAPTPGLLDPIQPMDTFDAFSPNNEAPDPTALNEATPANDDFDAFASADAPPASMSEAVSADIDGQDNDDGFGAFSTDTQESAQNDATDDFGQFGDAAVTQAPEMPETEGFGDFSDFPAPAVAAETDDQFNTFASSEPTTQTVPGQESEFDAFGSAPSPQGGMTPPAPADDSGDDDEEDFGDWGAFGGGENHKTSAPIVSEEKSTIEDIKNKISTSGDTLDDIHFGGLSILECIDSSGGDLRRVTRSFLVYNLLSSTHMANAAAWSKLIEATKNELATCKSLLQEMAKGLTRKDRVAVSKSDKLRIFLEGLREYVGVVRSIAASMADLQCLPDDIDLSNLDGWRTTSLLEEAFVVETQWSQMLRAVKKLGIKVDLKLESIPEMRKRTSDLHVDHTDADGFAKMVCSLTLQRLADAVEWNGRSYTAGAANLYANKISAVAPSQ